MAQGKITRREFIKQSAGCAAGLAACALIKPEAWLGPFLKTSRLTSKVIVLGIDGMDPLLLKRFIAEGDMPAFRRLMASGYFGNLQTTTPPQSPVAWSSFITGTNPGGHGIFDFIHRDAKSFSPYLSTARSYGPKKTLPLGAWSIPLQGGHVDLMRRGRPFWSVLEENDIPASLFQLPANFPVQSSKTRAISGMGTPDLLGGYGTFTYYSDVDVPGADKFTGGRVVKVNVINHTIKTALSGPANPFRADGQTTLIEFSVERDPYEPVARIKIQDSELILRQGEWSEWIPLKFKTLPLFSTIAGMVRMYLQEVHPHFKLYLSPINIDPMDPELPICSPDGYSRELSQAIGRFYTLGFPEDTKALSNGIFSNEEYLAQANIALEERVREFEHQFKQFHEGFFFFYFSSVDQNTHMMYRTMEPSHPLYEPNASAEVKAAVKYFYRRMDEVLRRILDKIDSRTLLMVLSDHGFAPFEREFHLNTWLLQNKFLQVSEEKNLEEAEYFSHVDWSRTKAYALGLNGIYINALGREARGVVPPDKVGKIKRDIIARLNEVRDPQNGRKVIVQAYDSEEIYSGPYLALAPDIIVGYESGYRISDEAALGKFPREVFSNRRNKWSADHCMDPQRVPGVLLVNRGIDVENPGLWDLAPTILQAFGLKAPSEMTGKPLWQS